MGLEVFDHYECDDQMEIEDIAPERRLTHLSLFSGIGGLDLAAEWAGFESVGQCEFADYPTRVLEKHWPDVPRWRDIRTLTGGSFCERTGLHTVDVISGGFPCQPFSVAGKQRGEEDDRYLWPEMVRVISELRPTWVIGENVAGIINMALDKVLFDLEGQGYTTRTFLIPAAGVNAPQQRYRTAIVAYTEGHDQGGLCIRTEQKIPGSCCSSKDVADPYSLRWSKQENWESDNNKKWHNTAQKQSRRAKLDEFMSSCKTIPCSSRRGETDGTRQWAVEPNVGRVANGVSHRVDRLRCLGNSVVPQQFYPIFQAIADIELGIKTQI